MPTKMSICNYLSYHDVVGVIQKFFSNSISKIAILLVQLLSRFKKKKEFFTVS